MDKKHDYKNVNPQIAVHAGTGRCMIFSEELSAMWEEKRTQLYNYMILKDIEIKSALWSFPSHSPQI